MSTALNGGGGSAHSNQIYHAGHWVPRDRFRSSKFKVLPLVEVYEQNNLTTAYRVPVASNYQPGREQSASFNEKNVRKWLANGIGKKVTGVYLQCDLGEEWMLEQFDDSVMNSPFLSGAVVVVTVDGEPLRDDINALLPIQSHKTHAWDWVGETVKTLSDTLDVGKGHHRAAVRRHVSEAAKALSSAQHLFRRSAADMSDLKEASEQLERIARELDEKAGGSTSVSAHVAEGGPSTVAPPTNGSDFLPSPWPSEKPTLSPWPSEKAGPPKEGTTEGERARFVPSPWPSELSAAGDSGGPTEGAPSRRVSWKSNANSIAPPPSARSHDNDAVASTSRRPSVCSMGSMGSMGSVHSVPSMDSIRSHRSGKSNVSGAFDDPDGQQVAIQVSMSLADLASRIENLNSEDGDGAVSSTSSAERKAPRRQKTGSSRSTGSSPKHREDSGEGEAGQQELTRKAIRHISRTLTRLAKVVTEAQEDDDLQDGDSGDVTAQTPLALDKEGAPCKRHVGQKLSVLTAVILDHGDLPDDEELELISDSDEDDDLDDQLDFQLDPTPTQSRPMYRLAAKSVVPDSISESGASPEGGGKLPDLGGADSQPFKPDLSAGWRPKLRQVCSSTSWVMPWCCPSAFSPRQEDVNPDAGMIKLVQ